jgi:5'-nucleotidase
MALDRIGGLRVTQMGGRSYGESVREEGVGEDKRYRISRNRPMFGQPIDGTDIWALKNNYISISPLQISLGHQEQASEIEDLLRGISDQLLDRRE